MQQGRLIPFSHRSGFANMAIDEYMIAWQGRTGRAVARVYGWDPPAVSLGRYQEGQCVDRTACRLGGVDVVRRITGGGAIFHDHEITYAVACGTQALIHPGASVPDSYRLLNGAIISFYADLGLAATYAGEGDCAHSSPRRVPFCFAGRERYDLMLEGKKIGGNAQRWVGATIFQHGSIPVTIDRRRAHACFAGNTAMGDYISLSEALGRDVDINETSKRLVESLAKILGVRFSVDELTREELREIEEIMKKRYLCDQWNNEGMVEDEDVRKTVLAR